MYFQKFAIQISNRLIIITGRNLIKKQLNDSLPLETNNPFYAQMCKIRYQINCHSILIVILIVPYKITLQRKNRHVASFFKAKGVGGGGRIIKKSKNLDKR